MSESVNQLIILTNDRFGLYTFTKIFKDLNF